MMDNEKNQTLQTPKVRFSWHNPMGSVVEAQVLPEDLSLSQLCEFLGFSKTTIYRLRNTKDFPHPCGPNTRLLFYSKTEVLLWLLKECGVIGRLETSYVDKENNIYLSLYNEGKVRSSSYQFVPVRSTSSQLVPVGATSSQFVPFSRKDFLKVILEHGFDMHFFENYLEELLPKFEQKKMEIAKVEEICQEVIARPDLRPESQDRLLLTYFRNATEPKPKSKRKSKKDELIDPTFLNLDYRSMIGGLKNV